MTILIGVLTISFVLQFIFCVVMTKLERRFTTRLSALNEIQRRLVDIGMLLSDLTTANPPRMSVECIDLCNLVLSPPQDIEEGLAKLISGLENTQAMLDSLAQDANKAP